VAALIWYNQEEDDETSIRYINTMKVGTSVAMAATSSNMQMQTKTTDYHLLPSDQTLVACQVMQPLTVSLTVAVPVSSKVQFKIYNQNNNTLLWTTPDWVDVRPPTTQTTLATTILRIPSLVRVEMVSMIQGQSTVLSSLFLTPTFTNARFQFVYPPAKSVITVDKEIGFPSLVLSIPSEYVGLKAVATITSAEKTIATGSEILQGNLSSVAMGGLSEDLLSDRSAVKIEVQIFDTTQAVDELVDSISQSCIIRT